MSLEDIKMRSSDLQEEQYLDSGGFGEVTLCRHLDHGLVILKRVYTGPKLTEYNKSLLEEGRIMHRLQHSRVVRLLGVIMEEGHYSLVMEYMKKGSLMHVLKAQVSIPLSLKGRIILETIEGMCYLHREGVIHKDLKPENILVDDNFHIKIADLGVASFKTWSKLTQEEHNTQRALETSGPWRGGGTLCYMAPEHLNDINAKPSDKSDVYSFAIVLWALFANKEPYENAISEKQLIVCIKSGNRPDVEDIIEKCPWQIISLMMKCWAPDPGLRPSFSGIEEIFSPFYHSQLENLVEEAVASVKEKFSCKNDVVKRTQSFEADCIPLPPSRSNSEQPRSLHSSEGLGAAPVEESYFAPAPEHQPEENELSLRSKLQEEANYHLFGSRMDNARPQPGLALATAREEERRRRVSQDPFMSERKDFMAPGATAAGPDTAGHPLGPYWNESCHPADFGARPLAPGITGARVWNEPIASYLYQQKLPVFENIMSIPTLPFNSQLSRDESAGCIIINSSNIQVGSNNYMEMCDSVGDMYRSPKEVPFLDPAYQEIFGLAEIAAGGAMELPGRFSLHVQVFECV